MRTPLRVLLVEDNPADARLVAEALRPGGPPPVGTAPPFALEWERTLAGGLGALARGAVEVVLLDMGLPDSSGLATLDRVRAAAPALPIVLLTGLGDQETALQAIASGAQDYLSKSALGLEGESLARALRYAVERQRLENEFSRLAAFPSQNPDPLLEADAAGAVAYLNPAALALFPDLPASGASHPLLAGWAGVAARLSRAEAAAPLVRLVEVGPRTYEEHISPRPDRSRFWVYISDVTERALVDRLKREFAQNVCHEMNTPLTCLYGSLQALREDLAATPDPGRDALLGVALRGAQHLADMVNDLGDSALAETGRLRVEPRRVDAGRLAAEAAAAFAGRTDAAAFAAEVPEGLPAALADPVRLRQVLNNLIGNARKFTPLDGKVHLRLRADPEDPAFLRFSVVDSGCGIDPADAPRVFERLFQAGRSRRAGKSLGIGLYLCRELVVRQGGRIWLESRPGEGAAFHFTLPVYSLARLLAPLGSQPPPSSLSVLRVDLTRPPDADPRRLEAARREAREALEAELSAADVLLPGPDLILVSRRRHGAARRLARQLDAGLARRAAASVLKGFNWDVRTAALGVAAAASPAAWPQAAARAVERRLAGGWRGGGNGAMLGRRAQV